MRLWHYKLIPVLPHAMLVSQWRECIAIKRQWEKGTLKHRLVAYVKDYSKMTFYKYVNFVCEEMNKRGIKYQQKYLEELHKFCKFDYMGEFYYINYPEHNNRYLEQCFYNLQEKYDRGIITKEEFYKILNCVEEELYHD